MTKTYRLIELTDGEQTAEYSPVHHTHADAIIAYCKGWNDRMAGRVFDSGWVGPTETTAAILSLHYHHGYSDAGA